MVQALFPACKRMTPVILFVLLPAVVAFSDTQWYYLLRCISVNPRVIKMLSHEWYQILLHRIHCILKVFLFIIKTYALIFIVIVFNTLYRIAIFLAFMEKSSSCSFFDFYGRNEIERCIHLHVRTNFIPDGKEKAIFYVELYLLKILNLLILTILNE